MSPILFNLALEPLLLSIQQDTAITGYQFPLKDTLHTVKSLAYADDICVILKDQVDYQRLQIQLQRYANVSNAKFNQSKTEAFSLNGSTDDGSAPYAFTFFVPEWRYHDLNHPTSILHACYEAFDHFQFRPDFTTVTLQTTLQLPLSYLFAVIPAGHWLLKHNRMAATTFFIYDPVLQRLRIKEDDEYTTKPRLLRRLKKQLLETRVVKLHPYLNYFILNDVSREDYQLTDNTLKLQFQQ
ncbi:hypothetical protein INT48_007730, partial [Thamnidium elegans]